MLAGPAGLPGLPGPQGVAWRRAKHHEWRDGAGLRLACAATMLPLALAVLLLVGASRLRILPLGLSARGAPTHLCGAGRT